MAIPLIENVQGHRRIHLGNIAIFLAACLASCMLLPAGILWLAFHDFRLVQTTFGVGLVIAIMSCGAVVAMGLRAPLEKLPHRKDLAEL